MKKLIFILLMGLPLASFSQDYEHIKRIQDKVDNCIANSYTTEQAIKQINDVAQHDNEEVQRHLKGNKKRLEKWEKKIASGKQISSSECLTAAKYYILGIQNICDKDYTKALNFIKLSGSQEPIDKMYSLALQYSIDKDITAAKEAMNGIDKLSKELKTIAQLYGLSDIYHERALSLAANQKQTIKRALRSHNEDALRLYEPYDLPEVDSLFAVDSHLGDPHRNHDFILRKNEYTIGDSCFLKCVYIHQMPWTLKSSDIWDVASYPEKLQFLYFGKEHIIPHDTRLDEDPETGITEFEKELCEICKTDNAWSRERGEGVRLLRIINEYKKNNQWGCYIISVMAQVFGQVTIDRMNNVGGDLEFSFSPEFKLKLFNVLKELVAENPSLQNSPDLPFTISSNGKVTIKESVLNTSKVIPFKYVSKKIFRPLVLFTSKQYAKSLENK